MKHYETPDCEVMYFETVDIITDSTSSGEVIPDPDDF